jgi:hypothetical protein
VVNVVRHLFLSHVESAPNHLSRAATLALFVLSDSQANAFQGAGMAVGARSLQVRTSNLIGDLVARLELNRPEVPAGREGLADSQANAFQGAGMAVGAQWAGMAVGARSLQVRTSNLIGDLVARLELNRPEVPASRHMSTVSRAQFNQSN